MVDGHSREMVTLFPTARALVSLSEGPSFCLPVDALEHAHFEGVVFGTRHVDVVLVFKDLGRAPLRLRSLRAKAVPLVKDWLTAAGVGFTVGRLALNWTALMATVRAQVARGVFWKSTYEDGVTPKDVGWLLIDCEGDDAGDDADDDATEPEWTPDGEDDDDDDDDAFDDNVDEDNNNRGCWGPHDTRDTDLGYRA